MEQLKQAAGIMTASSPGESADHFGALYFAEHHLARLLEGVPFRIHFCVGAVQNLLGHLGRLMKQLSEARRSENATGATPSQDWRWFSIRTGIEVFEHQFSAELQKTATYAVPDRGIFKTEGLVDGADAHIHSSVIGAVNQFAREEFQAAGRCLAFGLYSASGFHSSRAVESVLRDYHRDFLPAQNSEAMSMGQMAAALGDMHEAKKNKAKQLPPQNTVRHLKDFTSFDRNPLMHKTVKLEEIDAVTLFNAAASVIVEMSKEILAGRTEETAQLTLLDEPATKAISADPASVALASEEPPS